MRNTTKVIALLVSYLLVNSGLCAQQTIQVDLLDSVSLTINETAEYIQWQQSPDSINWVDLQGANEAHLTQQIVTLPTYFRASIANENCDTTYSEVVTVLVTVFQEVVLHWSDEVTWGERGKPAAGETVVIPENVHMLLDESPPALDELQVLGKLEFARQDLQLTCSKITVSGAFEVGTEDEPFEQKATITLTGTNVDSEEPGGDRGIIVMGGKLDLHGATPEVTWTKINDHIETSSDQLVLSEPVEWQPGDELLLAPTDFYDRYGPSQTQELTISDIEGLNIQVNESVNAFRWGLLQYATENGMSLEPAEMAVPNQNPTVLDERAEVANVTRNIVIEAPDDNFWNTIGFGTHLMIMGTGAKAYIDGVRFNRCGQAGKMRRYGIHWHMLSIQVPNRIDGGTSDQYIKNSALTHVANRGIVIHGTDSLLVQNNVVYDTRGHGIFTEDAVEQGNVIDHNLVLHVRDPEDGQSLKDHERRQSSGFWISNPQNIITNNVAADGDAFGFWLAFTTQAWGLSTGTLYHDGRPLNPSRLEFGRFENNVSHSNRQAGIMADDVETDQEGNTSPHRYRSTTNMDDTPNVWTNVVGHTFYRSTLYKNGSHGVWHRADSTMELQTVSADNTGRYFAGAGFDGTITQSLVVGNSLNHNKNEIQRPELNPDSFGGRHYPTAFATYHSTFAITDNLVINFQLEPGQQSGAFSHTDFYLRPVERGSILNSGNKLIDSHPGYKSTAPQDHFNLSGALWDPHGYWGPEGNYVVYNDPFYTHQLETTTIDGEEGSGAVSVNGEFCGLMDFVLYGVPHAYQANPYLDPWSFKVTRQSISSGSQIGTGVELESSVAGELLFHMRDVALNVDDPDAMYVVSFPDEASSDDPLLGLPNRFSTTLLNLHESSQTVLLSISFDGNIIDLEVGVGRMNANNLMVAYQPVDSFEELVDSSGNTYWQDKDNNRVCVKIQGGQWETADPLYNLARLEIRPNTAN